MNIQHESVCFGKFPEVSFLRRLRSDAPPVAAPYGIFIPGCN